MDFYENIESKAKAFVKLEYVQAVKYAKTTEDVINCRAIAFGAIQFASNHLFPCYNNDLAEWWNEYLDKFNKLALDKQNKS